MGVIEPRFSDESWGHLAALLDAVIEKKLSLPLGIVKNRRQMDSARSLVAHPSASYMRESEDPLTKDLREK